MNKTKILYSIFLCTCLMAESGAASLADYAEQSLKNNLEYKAANEALLSKEAMVKAAFGKWLPHIELRMGMSQTNISLSDETRLFGRLPLDFNSKSNDPSSLAAIVAKQKILDFSAFATLNMAKLEKETAHLFYQMSKQKTLLIVTDTYFQTLTAKKSIEAAELYKKLTEETYQQAIKNAALNMTTQTQVLRAKAAHQAAVAKVLQAKQNYQHLLKLLNQIAQIQSKDLKPLKKDILLKLPMPPSKTHWIKLADKHNFDLKAYQLKLKILKENLKEISGKHWPKIEAYGGLVDGKNVLSEEPADFILSAAFNRNHLKYHGAIVGINASMPLFAGGEIGHAEQEKLHAYQQEILNFQSFSQQLALKIDEYYDNLILAQTEMRQADFAVLASLDALQTQKLELEAGKITPVHYLETENHFYESLMNQAIVKHKYIKDLVELYYLTGQLDLKIIYKINSWLS
ncbi:TolC family protein [Legionella oakridgensis]|nr:TolC family protein [Legionella oakridgensis]